jgi:hypothetical protein
MHGNRVVDKFFQTLAKLASSGGRNSERTEKNTCLVGESVLFLLAKPEFHSHLAS